MLTSEREEDKGRERQKAAKRKWEEEKREKEKIKIQKRKKLDNDMTGNLGYVNKNLVEQIKKYISNETKRDECIELIHLKFLKHLKAVYNNFWKQHFDKIRREHPQEIQDLYLRKPAIT